MMALLLSYGPIKDGASFRSGSDECPKICDEDGGPWAPRNSASGL